MSVSIFITLNILILCIFISDQFSSKSSPCTLNITRSPESACWYSLCRAFFIHISSLTHVTQRSIWPPPSGHGSRSCPFKVCVHACAHTSTHACTRSHTHTHTLSHPHAHTHTLSPSLSFSFEHTHTHTHTEEKKITKKTQYTYKQIWVCRVCAT